MIKTLYGYIMRDLAKATALALVAFTLIMTVFAIIEPLRKEGLDADQAIALIAYTLPMMVSLTLPIAALFAATIVYGRFSQDNELMACRASGVSTISTLKPALALGMTVTIISLILTSFVTPKMVMMAETAVRANARSIIYHRIRKKSYVDWGKLLIHADSVDERNNVLEGLVVAYTKREDDIRLLVAPKALVDFTERNGETWVTVHLINPVIARSGDYDLITEASHPLPPRKLPALTKEEPSWYSWGKLLRTLKNPAENRHIKKLLDKIRQQLSHDMLAKEIVSAIDDGKEYTELTKEHESYRISAGQARIGKNGTVQLKSALRGGVIKPVEVTVFRNNEPYQIVTANRGQVKASASSISEASFVSIELQGDVSILVLAEARAVPQKRAEWSVGEIPIPSRFVERTDKIDLQSICDSAEELTSDKALLRKIASLENNAIRRLIDKIKAEMHMRAAYSVSCFLMVAMGAALGLVLRGGQVISAFTITAVPASMVIVMMIMGKQIVHSRDVEAYVGLMVIWGGVLSLVIVDVVIYALLRRR